MSDLEKVFCRCAPEVYGPFRSMFYEALVGLEGDSEIQKIINDCNGDICKIQTVMEDDLLLGDSDTDHMNRFNEAVELVRQDF